MFAGLNPCFIHPDTLCTSISYKEKWTKANTIKISIFIGSMRHRKEEQWHNYKPKVQSNAPNTDTNRGEPSTFGEPLVARCCVEPSLKAEDDSVCDALELSLNVDEADWDSDDDELALWLWDMLPEVRVAKPPPIGRVSVELWAAATDEADITLKRILSLES